MGFRGTDWGRSPWSLRLRTRLADKVTPARACTLGLCDVCQGPGPGLEQEPAIEDPALPGAKRLVRMDEANEPTAGLFLKTKSISREQNRDG